MSITYLEAIREAQAKALADDPRVYIYGQDVGKFGGAFKATKNLAAEYGPDVTCNAIAPGYIRTELNVPLQQNKAFNAMLEQRTAAHRWGKPEDLRGPLLLLASDAGAYMTGHTLVVDGGMTVILG